MTTPAAARALDVVPETVVSWARTGKLAGSELVDGRWRVRRAEVERILGEREAARERRLGKWQPMTERPQAAASLTAVDPPRCEAATDEGAQCRQPSAGPVTVAGRTVELCGVHQRQAERWEIPLVVPGLAEAKALVTPRGQRPWTAEEDAYLRAHWDAPMVVAAVHLGRTVKAVRSRRERLDQREGRA